MLIDNFEYRNIASATTPDGRADFWLGDYPEYMKTQVPRVLQAKLKAEPPGIVFPLVTPGGLRTVLQALHPKIAKELSFDAGKFWYVIPGEPFQFVGKPDEYAVETILRRGTLGQLYRALVTLPDEQELIMVNVDDLEANRQDVRGIIYPTPQWMKVSDVLLALNTSEVIDHANNIIRRPVHRIAISNLVSYWPSPETGLVQPASHFTFNGSQD